MEHLASLEDIANYQRYLRDSDHMIRNRGWRSDEAAVAGALWPDTAQLLGESAVKIEDRLWMQPNAVVVELGAGEAGTLADLKDAFPGIQPVAIDLSPVMNRSHVPNIAGDATNIPLRSGSVDIVYSAMVFCYVPDKIKALTEVWRVLRPGGFAAIELGGDTGVRPDLERCILEAGLGDTFQVGLSAYNELTESYNFVVEVTKPTDMPSLDWGMEYVGSRMAELGEPMGLGSTISYYTPSVAETDRLIV